MDIHNDLRRKAIAEADRNFGELELLTISELQQITKESESCWRKRLSRGELAHVKIGANVRVKKSDFTRWLNQRTVTARGRQE